MKRCPRCNRAETDDTLKFCRADGTTLISDSGSVRGDVGRARSGAGDMSSEIETSLPHRTDADINRPTAPTSVLPAEQPSPTTSQLRKLKRRGLLIAFVAVIAIAPVAVVLASAGVYFYLGRNRASPMESIAVLPFQNKSSDADTEYLSDGLAESLIYRLSQLPNLKVSPTSSVMHYKGKQTDMKAVAAELGVSAVLTRRIAQRGDSLTISVELIDMRNNKVLWGEQYERKMSELLATQRAGA